MVRLVGAQIFSTRGDRIAASHLSDPGAVISKLRTGPFLAFVFLKTKGAGKRAGQRIITISEIEEIHSTAGQFSILLKIRTKAAGEMEAIFERIYAVEGVENSETIIVFQTFVSRGIYIDNAVEPRG